MRATILLTMILLTSLVVLSCATPHDDLVVAGEGAYARGELSGAIVYYQSACDLNPEELVTCTRLGVLLIEEAERQAAQEQWAVADDRYTRALTFPGMETKPHLLRLAVIREAGGCDWDHVAAPLEQAVATFGSTEAASQLAFGWDAERDTARATPFFEQLVAAPEAEPGVVLRLAQLYEESERLDDAALLYERFLEVKPDSLVGKARLADVRERQGDVPEAKRLFLEIAQETPKRKSGWTQLLRFAQRVGDPEAEAEARTALEALRAPDSPPKRPLR